MGASRLQPVITRHTQVARVNLDRMRANVIEAAQQCGILSVPEVADPVAFKAAVGEADRLAGVLRRGRRGERSGGGAGRRPCAGGVVPLAVLIGPEGGFAEEERDALLRRPNVVRIALGPRILRADTAAVAALALVQAVLGDWRGAESRI